MVEIRGTLTLSDVTRFLYFQTFRRLWPILVIMAVMALLFLLAILGSLKDGDPGAIKAMQPLFVIFGVWLLLLGGWPYLSARRQMRDSKLFSESATYSFSEESMASIRPSASSEMKWSALYAIRETKSQFLLYQTRRMAVMIPKRFFDNEVQIAAWRELANRSLAPKKISPPGFVGRWF